MDFHSMLPLGGLALLIPFWQQARDWVSRVRSFFVVSVTIHSPASRHVGAYIWRNWKKSPLGDREYQSDDAFVAPLDRMAVIAAETRSVQGGVFWAGRIPVFVGMAKVGGAAVSGEGDLNRLVLTFVRGTLNCDELIIMAMRDQRDKHTSITNNRFTIVRESGSLASQRHRGGNSNETEANSVSAAPSGGQSYTIAQKDGRLLEWSWPEIGMPTPDDPLAALAIPPQVRELIDEFKMWLSSEKWFKERFIPWRRGWLLYGLPGTGKSKLARAVAQIGGMPLVTFDLSTMSNDDLHRAWDRARMSTPCVALFEDIDNVFDGRKNVAAGDVAGHLTFDCLLNVLSGVDSSDGIFLIVTTNKVDSIDPALGAPRNGVSTRPGRIDRTLEVPLMPEECRRQIAARILNEWPDTIDSAVHDSEGYSAAQVVELCAQQALAKFWEQRVGQPCASVH